MFQNDHQINRCAMVLCVLARVPSAWTEEGPTEKAKRIRGGLAGLSKGEAMLVRVAWDLWNSSGRVTVAEILETLDRANADAVATLLVAAKAGPTDVEAWIAQYLPTSPRVAAGDRS